MMNTEGRSVKFVGYEYKEIAAESNSASFLIDGYESFGWELDDNLANKEEGIGVPYQKKVMIRLKRNRKIINKMELTRLQRNFEACVNEIEKLEISKTSTATMYSLIVGIIGTVFMAGSVFAVTTEHPYIILSTILAIPGFAGWILPYFLFKREVGRREAYITPLIEEKYDEIYEICEKGNRLLH
jgi:hypothetical protein